MAHLGKQDPAKLYAQQKREEFYHNFRRKEREEARFRRTKEARNARRASEQKLRKQSIRQSIIPACAIVAAPGLIGMRFFYHLYKARKW